MKNQTVNEMYKYTKEANTPLLSNYNADFWAVYVLNYQYFDRLFNRLYKSWRYIEATDNTAAAKAENTQEFISDVYAWLMMNSKKYSEMFRIETVDDSTYSMLENYDMTEIMSRTNIDGQRQDSESITSGSRTDNTTLTHGNRNSTTTEQVSPYDSSTWNNQNKTETADTAGNDTEQVVKGQQQDSRQNTKGSQTNTENYTLTRKGNIGTQTATEVMDKHNKFWRYYQFYILIFQDILEHFLIMGC